jgi:CheY-like chemotaxis protein
MALADNSAPLDCKSACKYILVVEDHDDTRVIIEKYFEDTNYRVITCANGSDAIKEYLDTFRCRENAGILMDLSLPDINGLRVMSAIREIEKGSSSGCTPIRFAVVSAQGKIVEGTELFDSVGVTLHIEKPVDPYTFRAKVHAWLESPAPQLYAQMVKRAGSFGSADNY